MVTENDVRARVREGVAELGGGHRIHPVDPPRRIAVLDANGLEFAAWIVADEKPASPTSGYLVVFDEESAAFGLCVKGGTRAAPTLIGIYGSFATTVRAM